MLHVEATHTGSDVVTRRSILGSSGRVGYLGGANAAWVIVDVETGTVEGGGAPHRADQLTHDLTSGQSRQTRITPGSKTLDSPDPLEKNEKWIRAGVLLVALALVLLAVSAAWSVFV